VSLRRLRFPFFPKVVWPINSAVAHAVRTFDPILASQLPMIEKIIADETWLEGERRGCWVSPKDPVVRENVCRIILRVGQQLRERAQLNAAIGEAAVRQAEMGCPVDPMPRSVVDDRRAA
jgi:hypothetical protein